VKVVVILDDGSEYVVSSVKEAKIVDDKDRVRLTAKQTRFGIITDSEDKPVKV